MHDPLGPYTRRNRHGIKTSVGAIDIAIFT